MSVKKRLFAATQVQRIPIPKDLRGTEFASVIRQPNRDVLFLIEWTAGGSDQPIVSWGRLLVDFAHHAAQSLTGNTLKSDGSFVTREEMVGAMKQVLDAEWAERTDDAKELRRFTEGNENDEPS